MKPTLLTLLSNYKLDKKFNADESGLFCLCLPTKTYHLYGEKCSSSKNNKVWLTGMTAATGTVGKLTMFVIGKSTSPRCF